MHCLILAQTHILIGHSPAFDSRMMNITGIFTAQLHYNPAEEDDKRGCFSPCVCGSVCNGASSFDVPPLSTSSNSNLHGNHCTKAEKMILAGTYVCEPVSAGYASMRVVKTI